MCAGQPKTLSLETATFEKVDETFHAACRNYENGSAPVAKLDHSRFRAKNITFYTDYLLEFGACKADVGRTRLFLLQSKSRDLPRGSPHACGFERLSKRYADSGQKTLRFTRTICSNSARAKPMSGGRGCFYCKVKVAICRAAARARRVRRKKAPGIFLRIPGVVF